MVPKNNKSLWICGNHAAHSIINKNNRDIFEILVTNKKYEDFKDIIRKNKLEKITKIKSRDEIYKITKINTTDSIAIKCCYKIRKTINDLIDYINQSAKADDILIIMDQLNDVNNIGAIVRSCVAFGANNIIVPKHNFPEESSAMVKASVGTFEDVNIFEAPNINDLIKLLKKNDYWVGGLDGDSKSDIRDLSNFNKIALIIGSEGSGIRKLVKKNCDILFSIPISEKVESLNASNAVAIALYEYSKN